MEKHFVADPSPWVPITDVKPLRVLGKFLEEVCECSEAATWLREEYTPSGAEAIAKELADVLCNIRLDREHFELPSDGVGFAGLSDDPLHNLGVRLGQAGAAASRCIIQGIDESEPSTGVINRDWLADALIELNAACEEAIHGLGIDPQGVRARMEMKREHLLRWHQMEGE